MAKKVVGVVKLQINAGKATPAPPVGPALGGYGINMMEFIKGYNERTASQIADSPSPATVPSAVAQRGRTPLIPRHANSKS